MDTPSKRTIIVKTIRTLWESLESHLDFSIQEDKGCDTCGDRSFQAKTVKEYSEAINDLASLLK